MEYVKQMNTTRYAKAFENYLVSGDTHHGPNIDEDALTTSLLYNQKEGESLIDTILRFAGNVVERQIQELNQTGAIYINSKGGYHGKYTEEKDLCFIKRKSLVFPQYSNKDIRIKQFQGGKHYYAYIGETQVRDGDTLKWDTYEDAYTKAEAYI